MHMLKIIKLIKSVNIFLAFYPSFFWLQQLYNLSTTTHKEGYSPESNITVKIRLKTIHLLWLPFQVRGKHLVQALPPAFTLQCLTGKADKKNKKLLLYMIASGKYKNIAKKLIA